MNSLEAKILSAYDNLKDYMVTGKATPRTIALDISNSCNNNCDGCYFRRLNDSDVPFINKNKAIQVISESIDKLGVEGINFTGGGEPSVHPDFFELIKFAVSTGKSVGLISNCSWESEEISKFVAENFTYVRVGLDCENGSMYHKITKNNIFDRVISNIKTMVKHKKKAVIGIKYLLRDITCSTGEIFKMIELGRKLGVDNCQFKPLYGADSEPKQSMLFEVEKFLRTMGYPRVSYNLLKSSTDGQCILNFMRINVDADGGVYLCPRFYHRKESHFIGNVHEDSIYDIWMRDLHWEKLRKINPDECNTFNCMLHSAPGIIKKHIIDNQFHLEFFA